MRIFLYQSIVQINNQTRNSRMQGQTTGTSTEGPHSDCKLPSGRRRGLRNRGSVRGSEGK